MIGCLTAARTFAKYAVQGTVAGLNADKDVKGTKKPSRLMTRTDERYRRTSLPMTNEFQSDRITECKRFPTRCWYHS